MLTEPAPTLNPSPEDRGDPLDVVVLVIPQDARAEQVVDVVTQLSARPDTAVLVVFPNGGDPRMLRRVVAAGANHCVVSPASNEVFGHMQRARADARHRRTADDPLDVLWRRRAAGR